MGDSQDQGEERVGKTSERGHGRDVQGYHTNQGVQWRRPATVL